MSLNKKSVDDINVKGKRVLCRCDFNVPLKNGEITDENRLVAALPTIKKLIADGGKVILVHTLERLRLRRTSRLRPLHQLLRDLQSSLDRRLSLYQALRLLTTQLRLQLTL